VKKEERKVRGAEPIWSRGRRGELIDSGGERQSVSSCTLLGEGEHARDLGERVQ
jgi:hypothetical protein